VVDVEMPYWPTGGEVARLIEPAGAAPRVTCVCTGNPHAIIYCSDVAKVPLATVGPVLENAPFFPRRANIHFVQDASPTEVTMRTWERGSGITMACGTGASAVCVAGVLTGRTGRELLAHLPGGDLRLEWSATDNHVYMTGPAVEVFSGDWPDA
jgi:diaminopimelate epimerase